MSNNKTKFTFALLAVIFAFTAAGQTKPIQAKGSVVAEAVKSETPVFYAPITSPTLGELAEQQRQKQLSDMAKARQDAANALKAKKAADSLDKAATTPIKSLKNAKPVKALPPPPPPPQNVLHATYALRGIWIAEVYDGQRLVKLKIGQNYKGNTVNSIDANGIQNGGANISLGGRF